MYSGTHIVMWIRLKFCWVSLFFHKIFHAVSLLDIALGVMSNHCDRY